MAMLDAEITDDDYTTLIHILEEWEAFGSAEASTHRKETATLLGDGHRRRCSRR
ncbi:hypothetical protein Enr8_23200 [Blastopirellula retiformator]|uniref:Uncharacterized protein n=1 Tax=Blastopirellula retiformator TaxID=2527970 RepID=A0A5C5VBC8_9BACT|nr:hypothetical protein Enr8_23200 [Blastopirellula retiformator]